MCRLTAENGKETEKEKSDINNLTREREDIPLPSKSEIIRKVEEPVKPLRSKTPEKHMPVIEKPVRSFSIKEVISENEGKLQDITPQNSENTSGQVMGKKVELTGESLLLVWKEFVDTLKGEGPRIISMFKTIRPEMEDEHSIRIHLTNAAQKDLFVVEYKPKLSGFMEKKFLVDELDIETSVDLSETNELLYTDEQKYSYLSSKFPALKEFKKAFNLDFQ